MTKTNLSLILSALAVLLALKLSPGLVLGALIAILVIVALHNTEPCPPRKSTN
jgi:hypothetical protein